MSIQDRFRGIVPIPLSETEERLLAEYGAVFLTSATPPPCLIFAGPEEVRRFQASLEIRSGVFGEYRIELQAQALDALAAAARLASSEGLAISARAADSGRRSYQDTISLWQRNVTRGMAHWTEAGNVDEGEARKVLGMQPWEQVSAILKLEEKSVFFGTYFDKSILYSVAAPGASQHLSLLAFDIKQYEDERIDPIMAEQGWHRTVQNDLPHFTYLGKRESALVELGLREIVRKEGTRTYRFWVLSGT